MAAIDLNKFAKNNQKKNVSIATGKIYPALVGPMYGAATAGQIEANDVITLFNIPADCVITDCYLLVRSVATGNGQQATVEVKADAVTVMDAVATGAAVGVVGALKAKTFLKAGATITAKVAAQALTDGQFEVVVEFQELDRTNGDYLN